MPSNKKLASSAKTALPSIPKELIDQFVKGPMSAEAVNSASIAFKMALIERALGANLVITWTGQAAVPRPSRVTTATAALSRC